MSNERFSLHPLRFNSKYVNGYNDPNTPGSNFLEIFAKAKSGEILIGPYGELVVKTTAGYPVCRTYQLEKDIEFINGKINSNINATINGYDLVKLYGMSGITSDQNENYVTINGGKRYLGTGISKMMIKNNSYIYPANLLFNCMMDMDYYAIVNYKNICTLPESDSYNGISLKVMHPNIKSIDELSIANMSHVDFYEQPSTGICLNPVHYNIIKSSYLNSATAIFKISGHNTSYPFWTFGIKGAVGTVIESVQIISKNNIDSLSLLNNLVLQANNSNNVLQYSSNYKDKTGTMHYDCRNLEKNHEIPIDLRNTALKPGKYKLTVMFKDYDNKIKTKADAPSVEFMYRHSLSKYASTNDNLQIFNSSNCSSIYDAVDDVTYWFGSVDITLSINSLNDVCSLETFYTDGINSTNSHGLPMYMFKIEPNW